MLFDVSLSVSKIATSLRFPAVSTNKAKTTVRGIKVMAEKVKRPKNSMKNIKMWGYSQVS